MAFNKGQSGACMVLIMMCLGPQTTIAGSQSSNTSNSLMSFFNAPGSFVAAISAGPVWANAGKTQNIYIIPTIEKAYAAHKSTQVLADGEFFFGTQSVLPHNLQGQLGFAVATTSQYGLSGEVWDDAFSEFNNYAYRYKLRHTHVALKGKLVLEKEYVVKPWISASIGVGFNQSSNFFTTPLIEEAVQTPSFANDTTTAFTYTVGAGIQRNVTKNCQVGIGYEFADWGNSQLGRAPEQTTRRGLKLSNFYTNGLMFSISSIF